MTGREMLWPDTRRVDPPADHLYRSATWLLGRHPRLAQLAARVAGVVTIEDDEPFLDLEHLARIIGAVPAYNDAWREYERAHRPPAVDEAFYRWQDAGPRADDIVVGLSDFLVMSSGEVAALRLLVTLANDRTPFTVGDLRSMDAEGQRLVIDWTSAVRAAYGVPVRTVPDIDRRGPACER